jgi:hypothetical protein
MTTLERFHMYNETKLDNQMNDNIAVKLNAIFEVIIQINSARGQFKE